MILTLLSNPHTRAILLDIEGTTTPVEFVYQILFPYARAHVREFLQQQQGSAEVRADLAQLREEHCVDVEQNLDPSPWRDDAVESVAAYVLWLMDRDRKSPGLKSLQGKIWEVGYRSGQLRSQVYPDVPRAFARWQQQKKDVSIFSSGSKLAQKLLFAHTNRGDLTSFIRVYFDTTTGIKTAAESYQQIARALALAPSEILFVSDTIAELDPARLAGLATALSVRAERGQPPESLHPVIHTFDEIFP